MSTAAIPTQAPPGQPLPLVLPDSVHYGSRRRAWNLHADQRPAAVWVATRVEHVRAAVRYAWAVRLGVAARRYRGRGVRPSAVPDARGGRSRLSVGEARP